MELLEAGMPEAEPIVKRYLAKNPSAQMRMAYARVLLGQQRLDEARQQLVSITMDSPDYAEAWATLAALQLQTNDVGAAQASTERFGKLVPQIPAGVARSAGQSQYYLLQSQIAEKQGRFDEADALLRRIDDAPNLLSVQARRASLLARQGKLKEARALIEAVPASGPSQQRLKRLAEVQLLRDANQNAQAYALQAELQNRTPKTPNWPTTRPCSRSASASMTKWSGCCAASSRVGPTSSMPTTRWATPSPSAASIWTKQKSSWARRWRCRQATPSSPTAWPG